MSEWSNTETSYALVLVCALLVWYLQINWLFYALIIVFLALAIASQAEESANVAPVPAAVANSTQISQPQPAYSNPYPQRDQVDFGTQMMATTIGNLMAQDVARKDKMEHYDAASRSIYRWRQGGRDVQKPNNWESPWTMPKESTDKTMIDLDKKMLALQKEVARKQGVSDDKIREIFGDDS